MSLLSARLGIAIGSRALCRTGNGVLIGDICMGGVLRDSILRRTFRDRYDG